MEIKLVQSEKYIISYEYEIITLTIKKSGRKIIIGDFYGDPEVAFISDDESYCVIGGCGLIIYYLKEPFCEFRYNIDSNQWKEIFREPKDIWWVVDISEGSNPNRVKFTTDDEQHSGDYEIDVLTLESIRIS